MRRLVIPLLFVVISGMPARAAEQWLRITSPHFEMLTTAGEKKGREGVLYFETVRQFFIDGGLAANVPGKRVRIVAFRGDKEFRPYAPNEVATAFYAGGAGTDNDYIVLSQIGFEYYPIAVHEYTHLVFRHSSANLPVWLNEGMAELFSTLKPDGKKVAVGDLIPGRLMEARENRLIDLDTLFAVNNDSKLYNERTHAGMFYSESWALVHMLFLSSEYRPHFLVFWKLVTSGQPAAQALQQAFGKSVAEAQKDLTHYIDNGPTHFLLFAMQLDKSVEDADVQPSSTFDADLELAEIMSSSQRQAAAGRQMLERLMTEQPQRPEPPALLAELSLREGHRDEAIRDYAKAVELGSTNPEMYVRYALLLWNRHDNNDTVVKALQKAVELKPDYPEAQMRLGFALMDHGDYKQALAQLALLRGIKAQDEFSYFNAVAYANYRLGNEAQARAALAKAKQWAKEPADVMAVDQLSDALDSRHPDSPRAQTGTAETVIIPAQLPRMAGTMDTLECGQTHARLAIVANGKTVWFLLDDPGSVRLTNAGTGAMDFTCGKQAARAVVIEYRDHPDSETKTIGVVRGIDFQ
jgi:tetratricopeptide (TPR) repeat protein